MVIVGTMGGATHEVNLGSLMVRGFVCTALFYGPRPIEEKIDLNQKFVRHVLPLLGDGRIHPVVDSVFPLEEVAEAHRYMESNANFGKIVLSME